jgi:hypothetical protein
MRKLLLAVLLVAALAVPAYAIVPMYDKSNVEVGVEYGYSHQDIEDINMVGVGVGDWLNAGLVEKTSNVKEWSMLATLGYKVSPQVTPYLIVGNGFLNLDQDLRGQVGICDWSDSIPLLTTQLRGASGFMWGAGAKGDVMEFNNGIKIGYDARWTTLNVESTDRPAVFLGEDCLSASDKMKASLGVFTMDTVVSRYFDLTEKCADGTNCKKYGILGITPFVGMRWTHSDLNVKNAITIEMRRSDIRLGTEGEYQGNMISGLAGLKVQINKNLDASVGGILGQENGVQVKVGYHF